MHFIRDSRVLILGGIFVVLGVLALGRILKSPESDLSSASVQNAAKTLPAPVEPIYPHRLAKNSSVYTSLRELGVTSATIHAIAEASKPVMDLSRLRAGTEYRLDHNSLSEPIALEFRMSPTERLMIKKLENGWQAEKHQEVVETRVVHFKGTVTSSLWESAEAAKMDPDMIVQLAEIFAWEVDFARAVRKNDRWRISVEQKLVRGKTIGWGPILAAEYENQGELYTAVRFEDGDSSAAYYAADGSNLRRMFLKSPIKYGRISSRFNMRRFHPIHKVHRPHRGVDYAAPTGTPIRAVGNGTITHAGWAGGGGKTVRIRHNATYQTAYMHLSRFENGIRSGTRVRQGQVIGFVGTTGDSTGPHLHFEFAYNGRVVDPLKQKFPSADPISQANVANFKSHAVTALGGLPDWEASNVATRDPVSLRLLKELGPQEAQAESPNAQ